MSTNSCAICISSLKTEVYIPCSNNHRFHKKCLFKWAETLYTCPMCRENFTELKVEKNGIQVEIIKPPKQKITKKIELDSTVIETPYDTMACEICHGMANENQILLCDACDLGFHTYCLNPPLFDIPSGLWECYNCRPNTSQNANTIQNISNNCYFKEENKFIKTENCFSVEDEIILNEDDFDTNFPSTSQDPLMMSMKEAKLKQKQKKKKVKKKKKTKKKTTMSNGLKMVIKKLKQQRKKRLKRRAKSYRKNKNAHNQSKKFCKTGLKYTRKNKNAKASKRKFLLKSPFNQPKLDLFGTAWIPLPTNDIEKSSTTLTTSPLSRDNFTSTSEQQSNNSSSLLDEILINQSKILAPSHYLKINRDGTLSETQALKTYLRKKDKFFAKSNKTNQYSQKNINKSLNNFQCKSSKSTIETINKNKHEKLQTNSNSETNSLFIKNEVFDNKRNKIYNSTSKVLKHMVLSTTYNTDNNSIKTHISSKNSSNFKNSDETTLKKNFYDISTQNKPRKERNRISRWEPVTESLNSSLIGEEAVLTSSANTSNINSISGCNLLAINNVNTNLPSSGLLTPNKLDFFASQPSPSCSNITSHAPVMQLPYGSFPNFLTDLNAISSFFSRNPLSQNIITRTSTSSTNMPPSSVAAASAFVAALNTSKNLPQDSLLNSNLPNNFFDVLNSNNLGNLMNSSNLIKLPNSNSLTNLLNRSNLSMPNLNLVNNTSGINGNSAHLGLNLPNVVNNEFLNQMFNQQPNSTNLNFSNNSLSLKSNLPSQPQLNQNLFQTPQQQMPSLLGNPKPSFFNLPPPPIPTSSQIFNISAVSTNSSVKKNNLKNLQPCIIPPPPPTAEVTAGGCRRDSPMDIEDENEQQCLPQKLQKFDQKNEKNKQSEKDFENCFETTNQITTSSHQRSKTVKQADAAMKAALKPYFVKNLITKEEYKEIMKKGVAKLRKKDSLKPEKVNRFVKQYVELIAKQRKK